MADISKDELALYDRQIRLWGLETQKRIKNGSILIVAFSMNLIVQELCKNLALAGFAGISISITSDKRDDTLLYSDLKKELTDMHPLLEFKSTSNEEDFDNYDFISIIGDPQNIDLIRSNSLARLKNKCHNFCYEFDQKYFMINDFIEFTSSDMHLSFPSIREIVDSIPSKSTNQPLLNSFFESLKVGSQNSKLDDGPTKVAGSSIIAAIICQEIIKSFSKKDAPLFNVMILDPANLKNLVVKVGANF